MIIKTTKAIPSSEITDPSLFKHRRQIIKGMVGTLLTGAGVTSVLANDNKPDWGDYQKLMF